MYESKMNSVFDQNNYMIIESSIGFDYADFSIRIYDEMNYIGLTAEEVAKSCYIDKDRFKRCLRFTANEHFSVAEIIRIRKALNLY